MIGPWGWLDRHRATRLPSRWYPAAGLVAAAITLVAGVSVAVRTLRMVVEDWCPLPFLDQWDDLISGRAITWSWLLSQHNEHRLFFPRLIFIADWWLSGETNRVDYAANILIQAGFAVLIFQLSKGAGIRGRVGRAWAAGMCLSLLLWAGQFENFVWGFQLQFFGVVLAAAAAFTMLALGRATMATVAWTIVFETIAVYTLASGMLVPFLTIGLAVLLGRPRRIVIVLAIAAVLLLASYLWGYQTPPYHSDPLDAPRHVAGIVAFMLVELGSPIAAAVPAVGSAARHAITAGAGVFGAVAFGWLAWTTLRQRRTLPPQQLALVALAGFVVGMTVITATGRLRFGLWAAVAGRYATPVLAFWICVVLLIAARAGRGGRTPAVVMALALPLPLLMAGSEGANVRGAHDWLALRRAATPAVLAGVADTDMLGLLHPDPQLPLQGIPILRAAKTSIFADPWAGWLGTPLAGHVTGTDDTLCQGSLNLITRVADLPVPGWRVAGQAWARVGGAALERLLVVDTGGRVVGYGIGGLNLRVLKIPSLLLLSQRRGAAWVGAFSGTAPDSVAAYALVGPGPTACKLPRVTRPLQALSVSDSHPTGLTPGGFVDAVTIGADGVRIEGWGLRAPAAAATLHIDTNLPIAGTQLGSADRPDVVTALHDARLTDAGFIAVLTLAPGAALPRPIRLCVWSEDPVFGRHLLRPRSHPEFCPPDAP